MGGIRELFRRKKKGGRPRVGDFTIEELRIKLKECKDRNKFLEDKNRRLRLEVREERMTKRRHWGTIKKYREKYGRLNP